VLLAPSTMVVDCKNSGCGVLRYTMAPTSTVRLYWSAGSDPVTFLLCPYHARDRLPLCICPVMPLHIWFSTLCFNPVSPNPDSALFIHGCASSLPHHISSLCLNDELCPCYASRSGPLCLIPVGFVMDLLCLNLLLSLHDFGFRFAHPCSRTSSGFV
jgi:hypothetical protein